ncbi:cytohesin-interacting protein [Clupea harengus]|uniref:Cytohesin-interacting protein n=1 Tax=Clupea harengus TaxID=7950 RepID=A0A6P3W0I0_CLUHA|nr:cytohesin-interacting protein [Clupea harengus]
MTSTMSFRGLVRQDSQDSNSRTGSLKKKLWHRHSISKGSLKSRNGENSAVTAGRRQFNRTRSNSLVDYSDPLRTTLVLEKQDNEAYGFEVQTCGMQLKNSTVMEMCTFVCTVQPGSAAESAGLTAGDVIVTINGISIEGSSHQDIISLIRESTNVLKMETVSGTLVKRIELEKKLGLLKQNLRTRWAELQTLIQQERHLTRGNLMDSSAMPSLESLMSLASPTSQRGLRFSSDSSFRSLLMSESEDGVFPSPILDDCPSPFSPLSPGDQPAFFGGGPGTSFAATDRGPSRPTLTRTQSIGDGYRSSISSSDSSSPTWDANRASSLFGTLPRKSRKGSIRQQIFRFMPGINHSVEEEEGS